MTVPARFSRRAILAVMAGLGAGATDARAQSITWLGNLPRGTGVYHCAVSADGSTVVGLCGLVSGAAESGPHLVRWTRSGGLSELHYLEGPDISDAVYVS